MSMRVVAVVVSNGQPLYLQKNLEALEKQSFRIDRTLVVDSSKANMQFWLFKKKLILLNCLL